MHAWLGRRRFGLGWRRFLRIRQRWRRLRAALKNHVHRNRRRRFSELPRLSGGDDKQQQQTHMQQDGRGSRPARAGTRRRRAQPCLGRSSERGRQPVWNGGGKPCREAMPSRHEGSTRMGASARSVLPAPPTARKRIQSPTCRVTGVSSPNLARFSHRDGVLVSLARPQRRVTCFCANLSKK